MELLVQIIGSIVFTAAVLFGYYTIIKNIYQQNKSLFKGYDAKTGYRFRIRRSRDWIDVEVKNGRAWESTTNNRDANTTVWLEKDPLSKKLIRELLDEYAEAHARYQQNYLNEQRKERQQREELKSMAYEDMDKEQRFYERTGAGGLNQWHVAIDKQRKEYTGEDH